MKYIIIEDEPAAAKRLANLIQDIRPDFECETVLESISDSVEWIIQHDYPYLVFQDINLADGNSFEIFKHIETRNPIIFTTAYDEYAIDAFKVNTVDYLLKPIKRNDLQKAIEKLEKQNQKSQIDYKKLSDLLQFQENPTRFLIRIGQKLKVVEIGNAAYFYTYNKITFVITKSGQRFPIDFTMEKLENMLDSNRFFRINRQFIISLDSIKSMTAYSKSRVKIGLNPECDFETIVSTDKSPIFKKWLAGIVEKS